MASVPDYKKPKLSLELDDLPLNPNLIRNLENANLLTLKKILQYSPLELQKVAKISLSDANNVLMEVSKLHLNVYPETVFSLKADEKLYSKKKFALGLFPNNGLNQDFICTETITEICGESGYGKTQLCLYLSMQAQLPQNSGGFASSVLYIHSEGDFPIKRFLEMSISFQKRNPSLKCVKLADNLILKKVYNIKEILHVFQKGIPQLLREKSPKVIIIDSVAALLRSEYESTTRNAMIQNFAHEIWKLAHCHKLAVICVNQITTTSQPNCFPSVVNVPSLGLLWSNILTTRMRLHRRSMETHPNLRTLEVVHSSYLPRMTTNFVISEQGVEVI